MFLSLNGSAVRVGVLVALAVVGTSSAAAGQARMQGPVSSVLFAHSTSASMAGVNLRSVSVRGDSITPPTYRTTGAIIGGIVFGGLALALSSVGDSDSGGSTSVPLATIGGVALGALTGALIGGSIPKGPPKQPPDSIALEA